VITTENLKNTLTEPALDPVVVMPVVAGVMTSVSGMEIAVMISMMSVDLVGEIVVVTVMPAAGVIPSVKDMVIAVLISTTCVVTSMVLVKVDSVVVIPPTDVGVMPIVSIMEIAVVISI
jgi:hypothetical protein